MEEQGFRVGVYVDGFNLYYGGRSLFGKGTAGWKWLDLRKLSERLIEKYSGWPQPTLIRTIYCTARVSGADDPQKEIDQNVYLRGLRAAGSVDQIEFGTFKRRLSFLPLAVDGKKNPKLVESSPPFYIQDKNFQPISDAKFIVSVARWEEKGSDVNVGSHLLSDALLNKIECAIVISNDSDLRFPIQEVRKRLPVGTVNPAHKKVAGHLKGFESEGAGGHWWYQLDANDFLECQLPSKLGNCIKPRHW